MGITDEAEMILKDEKLLDEFRGPGVCELCGMVRQRDAHHYLHYRGIGGGSRIDHRYNLVALCRACHEHAHSAENILRGLLLGVVAQREEVAWSEIVDELSRIRNADHHGCRPGHQTTILDCGCTVTTGWRCPVHDGP